MLRDTLYTGFLWALLPITFFLTCTDAAPTDGLPPASSFYVSRVPDLQQNDQRPLHVYAGHLPSDPDATSTNSKDVSAHLYFVLVKNRRIADKERILFWFNGGPGCSSFDGLMMEVGPWRVDGKGGLRVVEGGWEEYTTMVYVDQPPGTGFSYTSSDKFLHELPEASKHFVKFLENFYAVFPEYHSMDTYLGGESYAGQYIPYFADAILDSKLDIPLKGAAIGNGWIDAKRQYPSFLEYAVKHGLISEGTDDYKRGKEATDKCMETIEKLGDDVEPVHTDLCEGVMQKVIQGHVKKVDGQERCLNMYDVRLDDSFPQCGMNWPPDLKDIYTYLQREDVVRAFHATSASTKWTECRGSIHTAFSARKSNSSITVLPKILERGVPVMIFAGDQDLICNYMGLEAMIQSMRWNGDQGLGTVQTQSWSVNATPAGTWVTSRNLTYVKIFNASHMPGFDVPHVTHDMILRFMDVNFSAIVDGSARIPSAVGEDVKPSLMLVGEGEGDGKGKGGVALPLPGVGNPKTPEQDKAMWEAYYNAGSAALVLLIIAILIGGFLYWRSRRKGGLRGLPLSISTRDSFTHQEEESIPLRQNDDGYNDDVDGERRQRVGKGKERARTFTPQREEIFGVGETSEDEDDGKSPRH
ncbi:alpha/beta-hydrolase [Panus rudis PR-1116 ss-1]|nr:alpha/beta-hydrolase [Panus rudis PR-1116 ss-1]